MYIAIILYSQHNSTYSKTNCSKDNIIKNNDNFCKKFDLKLAQNDLSLPIMSLHPYNYNHI